MMGNDRRLARLAIVPLLYWTIALVGTRLIVVPPEGCGEVTSAELRAAAQAAGAWIVRNQQPDGAYLYEWLEDEDRATADYNYVRHAGVTMSLYQLAGQTGDQAAFDGAERATDWMLDRLYGRDDWVALADGDIASLGGAALMLVSLAERRLMTGDPLHDEVMRGLGRFIVFMQRDDGGFSTRFSISQGERDPVDTSPYFPGEAAWALALLHEALPAPAFESATRRAVDFITTERDEVENVEFPPLNDHWASYAMAEMSEWQPPLSDDNTDYAERLAGRFSLFIRFESQKEHDGIASAVRGKPERAAALGTWVEGIAALWRLSYSDERLAHLRNGIHERAACGSNVLARRQAAADRNPQEAGAWFNRGVTRMDDQQHAISGLLYTADALEDDPVREPRGGAEIERADADLSAGNYALDFAIAFGSLLLVLNPLGAALAWGGPAEASPATRVRRPLPDGAILALGLLLLAGSLSGPFLDVLNVSDSSWRIAAGLLVILGAVPFFVQRDPFRIDWAGVEPAWWLRSVRMALWLATPAALALAISLGADRELRGLAIAAAVVVTGIVLTQREALERSPGRLVVRELARLTAFGVIAVGLAMIWSGVYGV